MRLRDDGGVRSARSARSSAVGLIRDELPSRDRKGRLRALRAKQDLVEAAGRRVARVGSADSCAIRSSRSKASRALLRGSVRSPIAPSDCCAAARTASISIARVSSRRAPTTARSDRRRHLERARPETTSRSFGLSICWRSSVLSCSAAAAAVSSSRASLRATASLTSSIWTIAYGSSSPPAGHPTRRPRRRSATPASRAASPRSPPDPRRRAARRRPR